MPLECSPGMKWGWERFDLSLYLHILKFLNNEFCFMNQTKVHFWLILELVTWYPDGGYPTNFRRICTEYPPSKLNIHLNTFHGIDFKLEFQLGCFNIIKNKGGAPQSLVLTHLCRCERISIVDILPSLTSSINRFVTELGSSFVSSFFVHLCDFIIFVTC